jgi:LytS/YehU family sensor histidine kinase
LLLKRLKSHSKNPCCFDVWIFACIGRAFFFGVVVDDGIAVGKGVNVTVGVGILVGLRVGILVGIRSGSGVLVGITSRG